MIAILEIVDLMPESIDLFERKDAELALTFLRERLSKDGNFNPIPEGELYWETDGYSYWTDQKTEIRIMGAILHKNE